MFAQASETVTRTNIMHFLAQGYQATARPDMVLGPGDPPHPAQTRGRGGRNLTASGIGRVWPSISSAG